MKKHFMSWELGVNLVSMFLCSFHLYTGLFGLLTSFEQRTVHVFLSISLIFLTFPIKKKKLLDKEKDKINPGWFDLFLIFLLLISCAFIYFNWTNFMPFMVRSINSFEIALAIITVLVILESARRTVGWAFPILVALGFIYTIWGNYIPGYWGHPPLTNSLILTLLYLSPEAVWGFMTGLSATYIAIFIIFGSLLLSAGGGQTFVDLSKILAGRFLGGPAKVAVIASGAFAMISGSPMANVATTGSFTIPMMKRLGYSSEFAAGVESTASTGGILTPPIMGAAGFVMAEFLGIPYLKVIIAAAIPAFLFYVAVFMGVHFQSVKLNLKPIPKDDLPSIKSILTFSKMGGVFVPIITLLYMLFKGYSLTLVGTSASIAILVIYIFSDLSFQNIKSRLLEIPSMFAKAGKAIIIIVPVLVSANMFLFLLNHTGLNLKFSTFILSLSGGNLFTILLLVGILVMILGCGLPVTAAYIMGVTVAGPALIKLGIHPMAAHLFILYYSIIAGITPPVCPTVYVGAAIAQSDWLKTAWVAIRLAPILYIMPFVFVFDNTYIMIGSPWLIIYNVLTATLGVIIIASGTMGQFFRRCNNLERIVLALAGILVLLPGYLMDVIGISITAFIIFMQILQNRREHNTVMT